jgi:adenine-specific DNA-methyltransferase
MPYKKPQLDGPASVPRPHLEIRKQGIYYTPPDIANALARWAITSPWATVLDPCFGSGVFLKAAMDQLHQLGTIHSARQTYGVENDEMARRHSRCFIAQGASTAQFRFVDFLTLRPTDFPVPFSVILGNPPYVRHHTLAKEAREAAHGALAEGGYQLSDLASYWAYFVIHAIRFLAPGGCMALVLPGMLLHAYYARTVRLILSRSFRRLTALLIEERLFPDALEESILLLAEGREETTAEVRVGTMSGRPLYLDEQNCLKMTRVLDNAERDGAWLRGILGRYTLDIYDGIAKQSMRLGQKAIIRIGAVTGANHFFVVAPSTIAKLSIPTRYTRAIISRTSHLQGLIFTPDDVKELLARNTPSLLICPPANSKLPQALQAYLRMGVRQGVPNRTKCASRYPWYIVPGIEPPDAFLLYMASSYPRLVLNSAKIACTNTIHGLWWRHLSKCTQAPALGLAFLTTLTQLSAELEGRSYGGGVLKLEPSEAARLVLPWTLPTQLENIFDKADALCRNGLYDDAIALADKNILHQSVSANDLDHLLYALRRLRQRRIAHTTYR